MAGEKSVAPTNGMQNVLGLLQTIAGTDTKTTSTANTGPLQAVMDQIAASEGTQGQALLESIFSQAAGAIPGIMGNTFNASGSRAPNNVMAGNLQKLMADVTRQAQAQLVQQQQNAQQMRLQAATQIANATRGQRQVAKSGASDFITKAGKILSANKLIKNVTGKDLINSGYKAVQSMFSPAAALPATGFAAADMGFSPLFGGTSSADFGSMINPESVALSGFAPSLPMSGAASTLPLSVAGGELPAGLSSLPTSADISAILQPLQGITLEGSVDFSSLGQPGGVPSLDTFSLQIPPDFQGFEAGSSLVENPLPPGNVNGTSTSESPFSQNVGTALGVYNYARNPNARKDIFDFSDGNFADDVGDITDAVSLYFPPAAVVRPALNTTMATGESIDNFVHNPGQWVEDLFSGDEPITANAWNTVNNAVTGVIDTVSNLGQDIADIGNDVGDFFGDVFGW